jgi:pimeloyl-ACP methyl ester carboxylesterase
MSALSLQIARYFLLAGIVFLSVAALASEPNTQWSMSSDGVRIAYEVHGDGPVALVFVHGWSCNRTFWAAQIEPFAKHYKVVAIDLGGHGESGTNRTYWTMAAFGDDVASVVKQLDLKKVILIGHSMGGDVIPEAALRLPGRVVGLVWVDAYKKLGKGRSPEEVEKFAATFRPDFAGTTDKFVRSMFGPHADPALVNRVAKTMSSARPDIAIPALESAFGNSRDIPSTLEKLHLPVTAINPDNAPTDTTSLQHYGVETVIVPGVGHFVMMEDPKGFNDALLGAVTKLEKS